MKDKNREIRCGYIVFQLIKLFDMARKLDP